MRAKPRVAVVTGASSGIGAALARQLGASGVAVGLTARRVDALEALAAEIRSKGGTAAVAGADAADFEATRSAIGRLEGDLGPVDLLIANAGIGGLTTGPTDSAEGVERVLRVNFLGAAAAIEAVLPGMIARGSGRLVGISSLAGFVGMPGSAAYSASKAAFSTYLRAIGAELSPRGIGVSIVHPGFVRTPMIEGSERPQPFVMEADRAARIILKGVDRGRGEIDFPWPTVALIRIARTLPGRLRDRLLRATARNDPAVD